MTKEVTICSVGKTGIGRSTLLNNILQKEAFRTAAQDGRVTLTTQTEHGFFLGDKEVKCTCIDTPGLVEKSGKTSKYGEQLSYDQFLTFIESLSKGVNVLMLNFDVHNIRFDANTIQMLEFLGYFFGEDIFNHVAIVFTNCDGNNAEKDVQKAKDEFLKEFQTALHVKTEVPLFFTSKDSKQDLDHLLTFALKVGKFDCKFLQDLAKIQNDETKSKLDQDKFIEEAFKNTIIKVLQCNLL